MSRENNFETESKVVLNNVKDILDSEILHNDLAIMEIQAAILVAYSEGCVDTLERLRGISDE